MRLPLQPVSLCSVTAGIPFRIVFFAGFLLVLLTFVCIGWRSRTRPAFSAVLLNAGRSFVNREFSDPLKASV